MDGIQPNRVPEGGKPQLVYEIEVLAFTFVMLAALLLYSIAVWGLTNNLRLTQCFPWSDGSLSNWTIWLCLAMTLHALATKTHPMRAWTERQSVLLTRLTRFGSLTRRQEEQIAGQLAAGGK
jgi:hypothetical protein